MQPNFSVTQGTWRETIKELSEHYNKNLQSEQECYADLHKMNPNKCPQKAYIPTMY